MLPQTLVCERHHSIAASWLVTYGDSSGDNTMFKMAFVSFVFEMQFREMQIIQSRQNAAVSYIQ